MCYYSDFTLFSPPFILTDRFFPQAHSCVVTFKVTFLSVDDILENSFKIDLPVAPAGIFFL